MEAIAALGLAANIAQFVATAGTVVTKTRELAATKKNLQQANEELEIIARDFRLALPAIRAAASSTNQGPNDASLSLLVQKAQGIAEEIEQLLNAIKKRRSRRGRSAKLLATLEELKLLDPLKDLNERLSSFRDQIGLRINLILLNHQIQIQKALNGSTRDAKTYKSQVNSRLDHIIELVQSNVVGTGNPNNEDNNLSWKGTSEDLTTLGQALRSWRPYLTDFYGTERIVTSLDFDQVEERRNAIFDAHHQTYQWIFNADTANLKTWLTEEHAPIYWVAGNAGSGKSTLMKFIHNHPSMLEGIREWAKSRTLHVASHFFWLAGTPIQQSEEGLLRSLLYQILLENPEITRHVFPTRWQTGNNLLDSKRMVTWSTKELLDALLALPGNLSKDCFFIFIDGLDEYSGEHDDLIRIIKELGTAPNVKLCVSSRPWLDFSDAFSASPWKLYLQDLTKSDIRIFVHDKLEENYHFRKLSERNRETAEDLVTQITARAQGVFLWVYLVVRSLTKGLVNADTIRDLQRRVNEIPQKLEEFFDRILDSIDPFYMSRTAKILLVLAHARSSLSLISFYFLDWGEDGLPFDPKSLLNNWPDMDQAELDLITTKKRQLVAQCKDLIDIIELPNEPVMFNFRVLFLHRTVVDFINQHRILGRLFQQVEVEFKPAVALFDVYFGQFNSLFHFMNHDFLRQYLCNWLLGLVYYAREVEVTHKISFMGKLHTLDDALMDYFRARYQIDYSVLKLLSNLKQETPEEKIITLMGRSSSLRSFASDCGLNLNHNIKSKGIQGADAQLPTLYIEKAVDFEIGYVTDEMKKNRPDFLVAKPIYNSTFEMFTLSEAEALKRSRLLVKQPRVMMKPVPRSALEMSDSEAETSTASEVDAPAVSEVYALKRSRLLIKQPSVVMTPALSSLSGPEAVISGQQEPNSKSRKLIRQLLCWR
ncbi:hypothetical protein F4679DRAFT_556750 [Xylaria curta]|nr:hypothetical protein F4679DRAFT_556750 [Xylaria curta]